MKKKISLPIVITIALIVAAITFSLGFIIARNSINSKLTDLAEKQAMFSTLSEVDNFAREKSFFDTDEEILTESLCRAYAEAYEGRVLYLTAQEFEGSVYETSTDYTVLKIADGNVIVVLTQAQFEAAAVTPDKPVDETVATQSTTEAETTVLVTE